MKVLIVEHETSVSDLLNSCLRSEGFSTLSAQSVQDAVTSFLREPPDLIILDFALPARGAINFLETVNKTASGRSIPVIILGDVEKSGPALKQSMEERYHIAEFIGKPFKISTLLKAIHAVQLAPSPGPKPIVEKPAPPVDAVKIIEPEHRRPNNLQTRGDDSFIDIIDPANIDSLYNFRDEPAAALIPLSAESDEDIPESGRDEKKSPDTMTDAPHIVVVDDEIMILKIIKKILEEEGFRVTVTHKSTEAFKLVMTYRPELLISDIMMPQLDGYALTKMIKSKKELCTTKVLLLTAKNLKEDKGVGFKSGADFFMQKPINRLKLVSIVRNLLSTD